MPIKTHSALAPSTASRMLDLHKSTQFVMEGIAEEQRQTQQRAKPSSACARIWHATLQNSTGAWTP